MLQLRVVKMKWIFVFALICVATCSGTVDTDTNSGSENDSAFSGSSGGASGGASVETGGSASTETTAGATATESTESPDATASATATASVVVNTPSTTPEVPDVTENPLPTAITPSPSAPSSPPSTPSPDNPPDNPTTTPETSPSMPPTTKSPPPPSGCDPCKQPDFNGFGFKPGKCGCCPWPCCCKCVDVSGGDSGPCRALLDLSFIMDDSGSIGSTDWVVAKQFFNDVVSSLTSIGTDQFVSSITFSTNASLNWNLNDPQTASAAALSNSISELEQSKLLTNPVEAMEIAINEVFVDGIDNPNSANVAVVMTDGRANFRQTEIADVAAKLRQKAELICIGVTNKVDKSELRKICDEDKIFSVVDFASLNSILKSLQTQICPTPSVSEKCFCCCTPEQYFGGRRPFW